MTGPMTGDHPLVERYLSRLADGLKLMPPADREEVIRDIRSHIAEAAASGTSLDSVLATLGPADARARAYAVELVLNPAPGRPVLSPAQRFISLAGILALSSLPTLIVVVTLGAVGVAFVSAGFAVFIAGVVDALGISLPFLDTPATEVHPALAVAVGPVLFVAGIAAFWALWKYLQWLGRTISRTLPT